MTEKINTNNPQKLIAAKIYFAETYDGRCLNQEECDEVIGLLTDKMKSSLSNIGENGEIITYEPADFPGLADLKVANLAEEVLGISVKRSLRDMDKDIDEIAPVVFRLTKNGKQVYNAILLSESKARDSPNL